MSPWHALAVLADARGLDSELVYTLDDETLWLGTTDLILRHDGPDGDSDSEASAQAYLVARSFLSRLRSVSRQYDMERSCGSFRRITIPKNIGSRARTLVRSAEKFNPRIIIRDYMISTAVTMDGLRAAVDLPADYEPPVHSEVMLDALEALVDEDHKKSILYAAIAVEAYVSSCLDAAYAAILLSRPQSMRVIERNGAPSDPVYEALKNVDSKGRMFHERSLYVLGRSLLIHNEPVYTRAKKLFESRNRIAHSGTTPPGTDVFALTRKGAVSALKTAIDVLAWYGDSGPYKLYEGFATPDGKLVTRLE